MYPELEIPSIIALIFAALIRQFSTKILPQRGPAIKHLLHECMPSTILNNAQTRSQRPRGRQERTYNLKNRQDKRTSQISMARLSHNSTNSKAKKDPIIARRNDYLNNLILRRKIDKLTFILKDFSLLM